MAGFQNDPGTVQQEAGFGFLGRLWTESFTDGITATPSGTQANSVVLNSMFNRVATVATVGDGVLLPGVTSFPGGALSICVINDAANTMTVYGSGSDTINGQTGSVGVAQMGKSIAFYQCSQAGKWIAQGLGSGYASGNSSSFPTYSTQTGVTATPSGTQSTSVLITGTQVQFSTVAAGAGSRLPPAQAGMELTVINNGANPLAVFPASAANGGVTGGDAINALGQNSAFSLAAGTPTIFYCFVTGTWVTK